jgi:hypothetical protein
VTSRVSFFESPANGLRNRPYTEYLFHGKLGYAIWRSSATEAYSRPSSLEKRPWPNALDAISLQFQEHKLLSLRGRIAPFGAFSLGTG